MAHNIATDAITGKDMVYTAGALPWHKLGQNVADARSWEDALNLAGLNWEVSEEPMRTDYGIIKTHKAIVRADQPALVLGIVGKDYQPIQNQVAFDFTEALLETGALYESAGALGQGERIWTLARIPQADFAIGDDKHMSYLLFTTSHDGSLAATVKVTDVRVVCNNTLTMALCGNGANMKIRHTKTADERLRAAQRMISNTIQSAESLADKFTKLAHRRLTKDSMTAILDRLFPKPAENASQTRRENLVGDILDIYESNDRNAFPEQRGTAYNLLNAVTSYTDHVRGARITDSRSSMTMDQARAENALFGTGERLKAEAFDVIYKLTDGTEEPRTEYRFVPQDGADILADILNNN